MSKKLSHQQGLTRIPIDHEHARELEVASDILDEFPSILAQAEHQEWRNGLLMKWIGRLLLMVFLVTVWLAGCRSPGTTTPDGNLPTDDDDGRPDFERDGPYQHAESELCYRHVAVDGPNDGQQQTASLLLDIDGDGDEDFVITERTESPSVVLYRYGGESWSQYVIDDTVLHIEAGGSFADIDDDGDLDISFAGDWQSNQVWWWENPAPDFDPSTPWTRRIIKDGGNNQHHDQVFGDFDDDGRLELAIWNQGAQQLLLAEIPDDPHSTEPWSYTDIYSYSGESHEGLVQADINGDGTIDLVGGGRWFEHNDGTDFTAHVVDDAQRFGRAAAGQLRPGGWTEIVFGPGDGVGSLKWYEWNGVGWDGYDLLEYEVDHGHSLQIVDFDGDDNLDIFCAEMRLDGGNDDAMMWLFRGDGQGIFEEVVIATGYGNHESRMGDLDGDGDLEILGKPYNWEAPRVDVWMNCTGEGLSLDRWRRYVVDDDRPHTALFVAASDLDGDGSPDIATGGWWYRNPGGAAGEWQRAAFGDALLNLAVLHDFDGDGDIDALGTQGEGSSPSSVFAWAQNNGSGDFVVLENIEAGDGDFLQGVCAGELQSGAGVEVALSWHEGGKGVQLLSVPLDPTASTWSWAQIATESQDEQLSCGDIDNDSDLDILLGTLWLQNDGESFHVQTLFASGGDPDRNRLRDMNGDGRLDAIVGYEAISVAGTLAWYEQPESATDLWSEHIISNTVVGPMSLDVGDLDEDGDIDVVVGEHDTVSPDEAKLIVYENVDGQGLEWLPHLVYKGDEHHDGAQLVDIDGDEDLDIISIGWTHERVLLYENLTR